LILESYGILAFRLGIELEADAAQTQKLMLYVLSGNVLAVLLVLVVDIIRRAKRPEDTEEHQALQARHHEIDQQLIRLQGRHEQLQSQHSRRQSQLETQAQQLSGLDGELASYRAAQEQRGLDAARRTTELDNARKALEQERSRERERASVIRVLMANAGARAEQPCTPGPGEEPGSARAYRRVRSPKLARTTAEGLAMAVARGGAQRLELVGADRYKISLS
jgi:hypothetical protein